MLHSINAELGLYVIGCDAGYSVLGFEVAARKAAKVAEWCGHASPAAPQGTPEAFAEYSAIITAGSAYASRTGRRCDAELTPQLSGMEGRKVTVLDTYGETRTFVVGKSTGWLPCHLELRSWRSSGGGAVFGAPFASLHVVSKGNAR